MKLTNRLSEYVRACFTGIWIESHEHQDALTEIAQLCLDQQWQLATWDIESGLSVSGQAEQDASGNDPLAAIRSINALATPDGTLHFLATAGGSSDATTAGTLAFAPPVTTP